MSSNMENLIILVNRLHECFTQLGSICPIDLPQIAVVGEQSAGKSSVLENFVGKDFLPRGSGIVTRCPLILQLTHQPGEEYAQFLHTKDKKFTDFLKVRNEIEAETERMTGTNKNVSHTPINLRIYSPNVLNLTVIDLPGLTKVPVGDQPKDIEAQIREMILHYISSPNCLILAVTPAIIDLANSEALKMAREVDPEGARTIGVITKIDMMDGGTDCKEVLENRVYKLKRGYVGIVNRSQADINGKKNILEAQESELKFFEKHPVYCHMAERMGSRFLQKTLNQQLAQHIKETLPSIKQKIQQQIKDIELNHSAVIHKSDSDDTENTKIFMTIIQQFARQIDVVLGYQQEFVDTKELSGGSVINRILYQRFPFELVKVRPDPTKMRSEIKMAIINSQGVRSTIFTPDVAFTSVVKKHISETRSCCNRIVELVSSEVIKIIEKALGEKFAAYPCLMAEMMRFCQEQLSETSTIAKNYTNFYIDAELAHINTKHPDFQVLDKGKQEGDESSKKPAKPVDTKMYKRGPITVCNMGFLKSNRLDYIILKGNSLFCFKDDKAQELRYQIFTDGCVIKDSESTSSKKNNFVLFQKDGKMLNKEFKTLEFSCQTNEELLEWKSAFLEAGVPCEAKPESKKDATGPSNIGNENDSIFASRVEFIYTLVDSYLKIVNKNQVDIISKICVSCIITKMRQKIPTESVARLVSSNSIEHLMKESDDVIEERKRIQKIYKSCKEAMNFINSVMNNMNSDQKAQKYSGTRATKAKHSMDSFDEISSHFS